MMNDDYWNDLDVEEVWGHASCLDALKYYQYLACLDCNQIFQVKSSEPAQLQKFWTTVLAKLKWPTDPEHFNVPSKTAFCKSSFAASPCRTLGYLGKIANQTAQSRTITVLQPTFRCQTVVHGAVMKGVPDCFFVFDRWFFSWKPSCISHRAAESLALVPVLCGRDEGPEGIHEERPSHSQMQCFSKIWDHRRT